MGDAESSRWARGLHGKGSHPVPTALPQTQVTEDPLAAVTSRTRCIYEVSHTPCSPDASSCPEAHQHLSSVQRPRVPGPGGDEHSPVSSSRFLLTSAMLSPVLLPVTGPVHFSLPEAFTSSPLIGQHLPCPSLSGHLLAPKVTSKVSGHTGFDLSLTGML